MAGRDNPRTDTNRSILGKITNYKNEQQVSPRLCESRHEPFTPDINGLHPYMRPVQGTLGNPEGKARKSVVGQRPSTMTSAAVTTQVSASNRGLAHVPSQQQRATLKPQAPSHLTGFSPLYTKHVNKPGPQRSGNGSQAVGGTRQVIKRRKLNRQQQQHWKNTAHTVEVRDDVPKARQNADATKESPANLIDQLSRCKYPANPALSSHSSHGPSEPASSMYAHDDGGVDHSRPGPLTAKLQPPNFKSTRSRAADKADKVQQVRLSATTTREVSLGSESPMIALDATHFRGKLPAKGSEDTEQAQVSIAPETFRINIKSPEPDSSYAKCTLNSLEKHTSIKKFSNLSKAWVFVVDPRKDLSMPKRRREMDLGAKPLNVIVQAAANHSTIYIYRRVRFELITPEITSDAPRPAEFPIDDEAAFEKMKTTFEGYIQKDGGFQQSDEVHIELLP